MRPGAERCKRTFRVLLAEDDDDLRHLIALWLREEGFEVTACSSGLDLLAYLKQSVLSEELPEFDLVLSDIHMPLGSAMDVLEEFHGCDGVPPTVLITAFGSARTGAAASRLGAAAVLDKPLDKGRLMAEIRRLRSASTVGGTSR
jgi:DNA-binding response OmpR family regulator